MRTARDRGIRVIADFVDEPHLGPAPVVPGGAREPRLAVPRLLRLARREARGEAGRRRLPRQEDSNWAWDEQAGQFYLHRFYSHQPDLNVANPQVRDELAQVMGFWLEQGLSGFRVDAVPFLIEPTGLPEDAIVDPHELLRDLRAYVNRRNGDAVLLGEVNLPGDATCAPSSATRTATSCTWCSTSSATRRSTSRSPAARPSRWRRRCASCPRCPQTASLGRFVRNHDELTLDKLPEEERQEVFARFGPDPGHAALRARAAPPPADHARRRPSGRSAWSTRWRSPCPGTPVLFYGEEIGMGENLAVEGRMSVRTPMQWSPEPHGGFSTARTPPGCAGRSPPARFGPEHVNVAAQRRDPDSLLNWFERLIRRRRECPELGFGTLELLDDGAPSVLAHRCDWDGSTIVAVHELAGREAEVALPVEDGEALVRPLRRRRARAARDARAPPYAAHWFRVRRPAGGCRREAGARRTAHGRAPLAVRRPGERGSPRIGIAAGATRRGRGMGRPMRALVWHGPERMSVEEVPNPSRGRARSSWSPRRWGSAARRSRASSATRRTARRR